MLNDNNKIYGDPRSEESMKLISSFLIKHHTDKDENSLWVRFNQLMGKAHDQELDHRATWNSYLRVVEEKMK
jgi:hypothetical protein